MAEDLGSRSYLAMLWRVDLLLPLIRIWRVFLLPPEGWFTRCSYSPVFRSKGPRVLRCSWRDLFLQVFEQFKFGKCREISTVVYNRCQHKVLA